MKKTYIIPTSRVHEIHLVSHLMFGSTDEDSTSGNVDTGEGGGVNQDDFTPAARENNGNNIWSNEW